jgi:hypothetical protein
VIRSQTASPGKRQRNDGDALALTFAYPVASNDPAEEYEMPEQAHWMLA